MANETASTQAGDRPRRLWQVPVFIAGVAALVAVWFARPLIPTSPADHLGRELRTVRQQLGRSDADLDAVLAAAQKALEAAESLGDRLAEAHYLLGSAHLRLAARAAGQAREVHYKAAFTHLDQAEKLGVPDEDAGALRYRLGKAGFYTGADRTRVALLLAKSIEQADDRADCLNLLSQAYLQLPSPDLGAALRANEMLRQVPLVGEEVLAPARLQAGEILLRMQKPDEARKVLEKVGAQAPAEVRAKALVLRARSLQADGRWADAAKVWQQVLAEPQAPADAPAVLWNLGLCQLRTDQPREAIRAWEECLRTARGDEAAAAAVALAEARLGGEAPELALDPLARAIEGIDGPADWKNSLVELNKARQVFEKAVQALRLARRYDAAVRAAALYARLAAPGRAAVLRAEAAAEWAAARRAAAADLADDEAKKAEEVQAAALFAQAGDAYAQAAAAFARPAEGAEFLWLAAARQLDAGDLPKACALLERFVPLCDKPERAGEAWYLLGKARQELGNEPAALEAYREAIKQPSPFAYRARYQLALVAVKKGDLDDAEAALDQNLKLLRFDPDPAAQEQSLFALGNILYQRRNYRMVVRRLEEALGRFPANPEATRARYQLAESYRRLAAEENQNLLVGEYRTPEAKEHSRREYRRWQQRAAEEFTGLAQFLETPEAAGHLTPEEAVQVPFTAADCRFNLGQYEDALALYERLARRHPPDRVEHLNALGGVVRCLSALGRSDEVGRRLLDLRAALAKMDDTVKAQWEEWLRIASKPVGNP